MTYERDAPNPYEPPRRTERNKRSWLGSRIPEAIFGIVVCLIAGCLYLWVWYSLTPRIGEFHIATSHQTPAPTKH